MVVQPRQTTLAYRCPVCGGGVMSVVDVFSLSADMVKLKCDCGESEMTVVRGSDNKVHFTVPCMICAKPHYYTLSSNTFFNKDIFLLPCSLSGLDVAMMGDTERVKAELARGELELLDLLAENGLKDLDKLKSEEVLTDPQVKEIVLYVIKELDEEGKIVCRCEGEGEREYDIEFLPRSMLVSCRGCGAKKEIPTESLIDAHEFLNVDSLTLE